MQVLMLTPGTLISFLLSTCYDFFFELQVEWPAQPASHAL